MPCGRGDPSVIPPPGTPAEGVESTPVFQSRAPLLYHLLTKTCHSLLLSPLPSHFEPSQPRKFLISSETLLATAQVRVLARKQRPGILTLLSLYVPAFLKQSLRMLSNELMRSLVKRSIIFVSWFSFTFVHFLRFHSIKL